MPSAAMKSTSAFRALEPAFFSGLLDDPVLQVYIRPLGRSLLFDCGRIHHLAKRVLKSVSALFITHAHMDHFMGIDTFIRSIHVSPRQTDIFGPPGLADKLAAKLAGYDWNLTEPYWCSLRVHEVFADRLEMHLFSGPEAFARRSPERRQREGGIIFRNRFLSVEAAECDHRIPSLVFRISESPSYRIDGSRLEKAGLIAGPWLGRLKKCFHTGELAEEYLMVPHQGKQGEVTETRHNAGELYQSISKNLDPASIGYVTDIGFTDENMAKICTLLSGVTLLVCECSFLAADRDKARTSAHLCTADLNILLQRLRPAVVLPMHLSKSYIHCCERLYEELELPPGTTLFRLPNYLTSRPLLSCEAARLV
jgi:ribonuclease Z